MRSPGLLPRSRHCPSGSSLGRSGSSVSVEPRRPLPGRSRIDTAPAPDGQGRVCRRNVSALPSHRSVAATAGRNISYLKTGHS